MRLTTPPRIPVYIFNKRKEYSPLGLGMVLSHAQLARGGELARAFDFRPRMHSSLRSLLSDIDMTGPGIVLFSNFMWNSELHDAVGAAVKRFSPQSIVVHGGPSVPRNEAMCSDYFAARPYLDIAARGEADAGLTDMLTALAAATDWRRPGDSLSGVAGFSVRAAPGTPEVVHGLLHGVPRDVLHNPSRGRTENLDDLPSPYLTGFFDDPERRQWWSATLETNRGCPYGCTFCDWGASTLQKLRLFSLDRVDAEIEWIARQQNEIIWVADANFGILDRDIEVAEMIAKWKRKYGFPQITYVNYAKNATRRVAEVVKILHGAGLAAEGMIAFQTTDEPTLERIRRSNIKTEKYGELLGVFREEKMPVSTDLLIGLPGATVETFTNDLQYCFERGIHLRGYLIGVWPNSPMADPDYMRENQIQLDESQMIRATLSFTEDDLKEMVRRHDGYLVLMGLGILRHYGQFLQADHGIRALTFLTDLLNASKAGDRIDPALAETIERLVGQSRTWQSVIVLRSWMLGFDWHRFGHQIVDFIKDRYGIDDPALETIRKMQADLMPGWGKPFEQTLTLDHDVLAWSRDQIGRDGRLVATLGDEAEHPERAPRKPLRDYGPGSLFVRDKWHMCRTPLELLHSLNTRTIPFELQSDLMVDDPVSAFLFIEREWSAWSVANTAARLTNVYLRLKGGHLESAVNMKLAQDATGIPTRFDEFKVGTTGALTIFADLMQARFGVDLPLPESMRPTNWDHS
jgi:radical SAM superfamily enzyme YgiQ (UPF0313 family)